MGEIWSIKKSAGCPSMLAQQVVTGVFEWDSKFSIGWAMVGRGELGLVMAEEAYRTGLTDELTFAATVGRPPLGAVRHRDEVYW